MNDFVHKRTISLARIVFFLIILQAETDIKVQIMQKIILTAVVCTLACVNHVQAQYVDGYSYAQVPFTAVKVTPGSFWGDRIKTVREVTIPQAFSKCDSEHRLKNFEMAAYTLSHPGHQGLQDDYQNIGKFMRFSFDDTDVYKTIEGACYVMQAFPDDKLKACVDSVIDIVAAAQEPDGYLYTARTINPDHPHQRAGKHRWQLEEAKSHELYNLGHLIDAACAHYQATGSKRLLDIACRYADCVVREVGPSEGQANVVPGHQIAEMALARLYTLTGERKYLDEAKYLLDYRGKTKTRDVFSQSDKPVVEQAEAYGHAVRAGYMYAGMADIAVLTGDSGYVKAIDAICENIIGRKYYLTGGVGARHQGEAFGVDYELPNLTAYNETCAAISMVYLFHRMFLMHGDARYVDCLERTLYNGVISGMSVDGSRFFYRNPLCSDGKFNFNFDSSKTRQPWFGCACCPSNLCRFIPSVPGFFYGVRGSDVYVNLFAANTADIELAGKKVTMKQDTRYPWDGDIAIAIVNNQVGAFNLKIRIPGWVRSQVVPTDLYSYCDNIHCNYSVAVNGQRVDGQLEKGYLNISRLWKDGDEVRIHFDMPARTVEANRLVVDDYGRLAIERGPLVYCAEAIDNKDIDLNGVQIGVRPKMELISAFPITNSEFDGQSFHVTAIHMEDTGLKLIPYYAWNHRGAGQMAVWLPKVNENLMLSERNWQFRLASDNREGDSLTLAGFYREDHEERGFVPVPVPSNWAVLGFEEPTYRGFANDQASEGFYRLAFHVPTDFRDRRVLLHFGGVWQSAEVWLNGQCLGRHDSGYTSFAFDVSDGVKAGESNMLAVRVRQTCPGYKSDTYDDWSLGGIYREVWLETMPADRWIERVRVETKMNGEVMARIMVADHHKNTLPGNYLSPGMPYRLRLTLADNNGQTVAAKTINVSSHTANSRQTAVTLHVKNPLLWTAETPNLYTLTTELLEHDSVSHCLQKRIGIREISTAGGVLTVNGKPVKLRGVNRHDEHPDVGRATTRKHWLEDLRLMKQANINYIRACHYQHAKGFIELCDSLGFYVGEEVSLGGADDLMHNPAFTSAMMLRTIETVERDIDNPSVIYWSIGNEDGFTDQFLQVARVVKGLDASRPLLLPWNADDTLPEEIDILAPHYWTAPQYDSIASCSSRPIITTEYVHAYGQQRMGGLRECWQALTNHPAGAGGAVWMWADQGLRTPVKKDRSRYGVLAKDDDYLRLDAQGWDGITDSYRHPTRDYWEVKAAYCPIEVKRSKGATLTIYNGYDFTNLNETGVAWQLFVDGEQKDRGNIRLKAAPHQTATFTVPTKNMGRLKEGQTAYVWLVFTDRGGQEIGSTWVQIESVAVKASAARRTLTTVRPDTGLPDGFRPTVWHKLNDGDLIIKNRGFADGTNPEVFTVNVLSTVTDGDTTRSHVLYEINDSNSIEAYYSCSPTRIDYELTPHLQTNYVPVVGLAYRMKDASTLGHWFGLGPDEAFPNKQAAQMLGLWDAHGMSGTRAMRWVEVDGWRIYCDGFLDRDNSDSQEIRLLSSVLGRPEKGRLNYPEKQLRQGQTYRGSIVLETALKHQ